MNKTLKTALFTTLIQLPVILWQHMFIAMYIHHTTRVLYFESSNITILFSMILATFSLAYCSEKINQSRWLIYWLIPLALIVALVFDSNFIMQIILFLSYLLWMLLAKPIVVHKVENYYEGVKVDEVIYKRFRTFNQAEKYLEKKLDTVLRELAKESKDVDDLNQRYMQSDNDYRIHDDNSDSLLFSSLWYVKKHSSGVFDELGKDADISGFMDLLKRGNLPDDDRVVPNWMKIKNRQFSDVDFLHNTVDGIIALSSEEFNEFVSSSDNGLLFTFLSTLSDNEIERFSQYNDDVVQLDPEKGADSPRVQFKNGMKQVKIDEITDEQRARAALEMPLMITFSKNICHRAMDFQIITQEKFFDFENDDFRKYEGHLVKVIWEEMKYIPDHFEQVLDHFKDFYEEYNNEHKKYFVHLAKRFGQLIAVLNNVVVKTQNRETSLNWFTSKAVEYELLGDVEISVSASKKAAIDEKLINFLTLTFLGIYHENDDNHLESLINTVEALFEYYPVNRVACEYAMVEMMKSVALKDVKVANANQFIAFFETLPRFYDVLNYDRIVELKELINHTLANEKPQDNAIFDQDGVKSKMILLNYLIDMEYLYYEGLSNEQEV